MKVTPQIEKILKREAKSYKLNMRQTKLLKKYRDSKSVLVRVFTLDCQILDVSLKPFSAIKRKKINNEIFLLEVELTPAYFFFSWAYSSFFLLVQLLLTFTIKSFRNFCNKEIKSAISRTDILYSCLSPTFLPLSTPANKKPSRQRKQLGSYCDLFSTNLGKLCRCLRSCWKLSHFFLPGSSSISTVNYCIICITLSNWQEWQIFVCFLFFFLSLFMWMW